MCGRYVPIIGLLKPSRSRRKLQFQSEHPSVEIEVIYRKGQVALEELRDGLLDVVIAPDSGFPLDIYRSDDMLTESYNVVFCEGHRFEAMATVALDQLSGEVYLDRPNCEMREEILSLCNASGVEIYTPYRSNRENWLLLLAAEGVGVAVLPDSCIPQNAPGIVTRPLTAPAIRRNLVALRYRKQPLKPVVQGSLKFWLFRPDKKALVPYGTSADLRLRGLI